MDELNLIEHSPEERIGVTDGEEGIIIFIEQPPGTYDYTKVAQIEVTAAELISLGHALIAHGMDRGGLNDG